MNIKYKTKDVAIIEDKIEANAIKTGLKLIKANETIKKEHTVLIIPNFVNKKKPDPSQAVTVGDDSLKYIIQFVKEQAPKRVVIGSGSGGGDTENIIKTIGYDKIFKDENVEFIDFNKGEYDILEINHDKPSTTKINKIIKEADVIISFTQLKHHEESTISGAIKNVMLSIPSTEEHGTPKKNLGIHDNLHGFIKAMAEKIPIHISIVSANPAMIGTGPTKGIARHTGLVIVGNNPLSTDIIGARLLGFKPQGINYLYQLEQEKIAETDIKKIKIHGLTIEKAEKIFSEKVYGEGIQVDKE